MPSLRRIYLSVSLVLEPLGSTQKISPQDPPGSHAPALIVIHKYLNARFQIHLLTGQFMAVFPTPVGGVS